MTNKPKPTERKGIKEKSFNNWRHNAIHLTFPNGNRLSTVWGYFNYCDNYNLDYGTGIDKFNQFLDSDTCEIMILNAPEKLVKKIHKKYKSGDSFIGYLTMAEWLDIVKMLSK